MWLPAASSSPLGQSPCLSSCLEPLRLTPGFSDSFSCYRPLSLPWFLTVSPSVSCSLSIASASGPIFIFPSLTCSQLLPVLGCLSLGVYVPGLSSSDTLSLFASTFHILLILCLSTSLWMPVPISPSLTTCSLLRCVSASFPHFPLYCASLAPLPDHTRARAHTHTHTHTCTHPCSLTGCGLKTFYFRGWHCYQIE